MLGMMNGKGGQQSNMPVQGQSPADGGMGALAALFRNSGQAGGINPSQPMPLPGGAPPRTGGPMPLPQIMAPQRPTFAPPPRIPMPQPAAAPPGPPLDPMQKYLNERRANPPRPSPFSRGNR
jgi:hypothetical protein